jgi:uncharacterized protein
MEQEWDKLFGRIEKLFREMRRKEKELTMEESKDILMKGEYGVLSTISSNGYPCGTPLNYVYYKDSIYFHSAPEGQKLDNMKEFSKVSFCTACDIKIIPEKFTTNYKSVVLFGQAKEVMGNEKEEAMIAIIKKYSGEFLEQGKEYIKNANDKMKVFNIEIEHITGKQNSR